MRTKPVLDLALQHQMQPFGDITAIWTWNLHTDRPCVVLVPTYVPISHERIMPVLVSVDEAWRWDERIGDPRYTARACHKIAEGMRFDPTPERLVRIFSIVNDCLPDLLRMPPAPRRDQGEVVADVIAIDIETGKTIHEAEVIDHV